MHRFQKTAIPVWIHPPIGSFSGLSPTHHQHFFARFFLNLLYLRLFFHRILCVAIPVFFNSNSEVYEPNAGFFMSPNPNPKILNTPSLAFVLLLEHKVRNSDHIHHTRRNLPRSRPYMPLGISLQLPKLSPSLTTFFFLVFLLFFKTFPIHTLGAIITSGDSLLYLLSWRHWLWLYLVFGGISQRQCHSLSPCGD